MARKGDRDNEYSKDKYFIFFTLIIFSIVITGALGYKCVQRKTFVANNNTYTPKYYRFEEIKKDELEYEEIQGIINILLIGVDGTKSEDGRRTDSILIATIDSNNKKIKLTSLYRDTLVRIPGYGKNKLNTAFSYGGVELLLSTIKDNYGIGMDKYLMVNFNGFENIVDEIGGVEIDVKLQEVEELNKYIGEATGGNDCPVTSEGVQVLNGKQALSYARIRKGVGDDFGRTTRQREILIKASEKLKEISPIKYGAVVNRFLENIKTNISPIEGLNLAYTIYKFPQVNAEQLAIPKEGLCVDEEIENVGSVLIMNEEANKEILAKFIFEKDEGIR